MDELRQTLDRGAVPAEIIDALKPYPDYATLLNYLNFQALLGLNSSATECPVMLCGYLLHAMNQDNAAIRNVGYSPKEGDQHFTG